MSKILVIEDDADLQFLYDKTLTRQGYEIVAARSTTDAIVHLTNDEFDLVILDINMPDMPGLKVLEFKQGDVRLRDIPVMVVSANEQYRHEAKELGARYYLIKPVPFQELLAMVHQALEP